jgi:hypothetical protein
MRAKNRCAALDSSVLATTQELRDFVPHNGVTRK